LPAAIAAAGALVLYLALYWGLFAMVAQRVGLRSDIAPLTLALTWTGLEFLQGRLFTGFPWSTLGYAAAEIPAVAQLADIAGVAALSFLVMLANASGCALALRGRQGWRPALAAGLTLLLALGYGALRLGQAPPIDGPSGESITVAMVQGSVEQQDKWSEPARAEILRRHVDLSEQAAAAGADLVVWAESAWPDPWGIERNQAMAESLLAVARRHRTAMLVGTVHVYDEDGRIEVSNAGVLYDRDGRWRGRYEKTHLVPFGEYLPFRRVLSFLGPLVQAVGELRPGPARQPLLGVPEQGIPPIGLSVCYEIIFATIARRQVLDGAELLATITNDAWYGTTSAPYQHFAMARLRAIENRRYLVRAANTGISGVVDPWGRVVAATALYERRALMATVAARTDLSLYTRFGDVFGWGCALVALVQLVPVLRRRERRS
jgi:apolipoprotein N-acyltransferase